MFGVSRDRCFRVHDLHELIRSRLFDGDWWGVCRMGRDARLVIHHGAPSDLVSVWGVLMINSTTFIMWCKYHGYSYSEARQRLNKLGRK